MNDVSRDIRHVRYQDINHFKEIADPSQVFIDEDIKAQVDWYAVYVNDQDMIGCYGLMHYSSTVARLRGWFVHPDHRGQGHGKAMLIHFVNNARTTHHDTAEANTRHTHTLQKQGFQVKDRYENGVCKMVKQL